MTQSLRSSLDPQTRQRVFDRMDRNASLAARIATILAASKPSSSSSSSSSSKSSSLSSSFALSKPVMESSVVPSLPSTYSVLSVGNKTVQGVSARALVMLADVAIQSSERPVSEVIGESGNVETREW